MRIVTAYRPQAMLLLCALGAAGCATSRPDAPTPYAQMGGAEGVQGIVDDLLQAILDDDRINFQFARTDIVRFRAKLTEQLCVESGGPCTYTGDTMQASHAGRHIDDVQFNALVEDLEAVMEARKVPIGAQNRLLKRLAAMHGDIVNPGSRTRPKTAAPAAATPPTRPRP